MVQGVLFAWPVDANLKDSIGESVVDHGAPSMLLDFSERGMFSSINWVDAHDVTDAMRFALDDLYRALDAFFIVQDIAAGRYPE